MSLPAKPTVLHYTGYASDGGGILAVVRALAGAGRFRCILGVSPAFVQRRGLRLPLWRGPSVEGERIDFRNVFCALDVAWRVRRWLRRGAHRVFHGHSRIGLLVGLWLLLLGERRFVVTVHCYGRQRWLYRWAARRLGERLFWLSPAMRIYYGVPGREWEQCIPGGVPPSRVRRAVPVEGHLRLGGVGSLVRWKGWHHVVEAIGLLPPEVRARVTFTHIGAGEADYIEGMRQRAVRGGWAAQVIFRGVEPSPDSLLGEIDALVVASENEPFSIAILEALAAGVPVLAADSGGAQDVIRAGVNGALYRTSDATALAAQIYRWLVQPPAWDQGKICGTTISIDRIARQWSDVYAAL